MLKRLRISSSIRFRNLLIRFLSPSHSEYTRFVILCHPRTGSTLLHTYLNSHWNVISYGNLVGMDFKQRVLEKGQTVDSFLYTETDHPYPSFIKAAGFKFFYQYSEFDWSRFMLEFLHNHDYKVIHLRRRDHFRTAISYLLAKQTSAWSSGQVHEPVTLDAYEVIKAMKALGEYENQFFQIAKDFNNIEVLYEELAEEPDKVLAAIQSFLNVPHRRLISVLKKQHGDSLEDVIANYQELIGIAGRYGS
jgi:LPS sulfotransferase NodH